MYDIGYEMRTYACDTTPTEVIGCTIVPYHIVLSHGQCADLPLCSFLIDCFLVHCERVRVGLRQTFIDLGYAEGADLALFTASKYDITYDITHTHTHPHTPTYTHPHTHTTLQTIAHKPRPLFLGKEEKNAYLFVLL